MSLHGLSTLQMQFAQFCGDERNSFPELRVFPKFTAFFFGFFYLHEMGRSDADPPTS